MTIQWLGQNLDFTETLKRQENILKGILNGETSETVLLLEHQAVYTIGRTRDQSSLLSPTTLPHPVHETNRGGQATYHGPGQLVAYPLINLSQRGKDLHQHLRQIESSLQATCQQFGLKSQQKKDFTGLWVGSKKIASIGVGLRKWITMHGLAINITPESLPPFQAITPCGLTGVHMTCLWDETSQHPTCREFGEHFATHFLKHLPPLVH